LRVSLYKSDRNFHIEPGESVLEAALAAGFNLPHSCKTGSCGLCRARLLEGEVRYPRGPPLGLGAREMAEGSILLCEAQARSDLSIDILEVGPAGAQRVKRLPCRIERTERLSHDVMALFLRLPAAEPFEFLPGQYIDIMLPRGRRRSFSIASPPHDARLLELHVRRVAGGEFTERLFAGDARATLLTIEGPLGHFVYRTAVAQAVPMLLIGGGTGFAPLKSILRHLIENGVSREMTLYWGVRAQRDLYALAALHDLERRSGQFRYVPVLSEPSPGWAGRRGFVHEAVIADIGELARYDVYASGPPAMIEAVRRELEQRGVPRERLSFDSFDYAPDSPARQRSTADSKS